MRLFFVSVNKPLAGIILYLTKGNALEKKLPLPATVERITEEIKVNPNLTNFV